jgi:hypothetical protein
MKQHHNQIYQGGGGGQQSSSALGGAAAMQALKMFSGGGSGGGQGGQAQMIGMAMSEASKLFDSQASQGNVQSGMDKQSVINSAAKMALQMYVAREREENLLTYSQVHEESGWRPRCWWTYVTGIEILLRKQLEQIPVTVNSCRQQHRSSSPSAQKPGQKSDW